MNIILFSTADWDNPFWTNKQHMAKTFEKYNHKVIYVDSLGIRKPKIDKRDFLRILKRFIEKLVIIFGLLVLLFYHFIDLILYENLMIFFCQ